MKISPRLLLVLFALVAVAQLFVPAKMIWDRESVLRTGEEFRFRTQPIDPTDPFRGKYISLFYPEQLVTVSTTNDWEWGEKIYVTLQTDSLGFATVENGSKEVPQINGPYIEATVSNIDYEDTTRLWVDLPFDRFYMEESKAYEAEQVYWQAGQDTLVTSYALVSVKDGQAVLKDVFINGTPIADVVRNNRLNEQ